MQEENEMKANLRLCFVDFQKAFDSDSGRMIEKVLRHYGVQEWLVKSVGDLHAGTFCKAFVDGSMSQLLRLRLV